MTPGVPSIQNYDARCTFHPSMTPDVVEDFYSKCRAFIHPELQISRHTPSIEMVKQDLILIRKASYSSCIVRELKLLHWIERVNCTTRLFEFQVRDLMNKCVKEDFES